MADITVDKLMAGLMALADSIGHRAVVEAAMVDPNYDPYTSGAGPAVDDSGDDAIRTADYDGLVEQAEKLGVKVDKRWGEERLRSEVEAAQAAQQE